MNAQDAWQTAFHQLELQLDRGSFDTWLRGAVFHTLEDGVYVIAVRNDYARDMLQHRLYRNVRRVLSDVCGHPVELRFVTHRQPTSTASTEADTPLFRLLAQQTQQETTSEEAAVPLHQRLGRPQRPALPESELNPRFTFERFIVNGSNRITYEAARAVVDHPAQAYNPFFVYGGVGLGKTHLLQAIAHAYQQRGLRVIYIPSEVFTNDLVDAIRHKTTAMFRDKYRSVDALLVDDIQFIAGKDSTQEEFFHTFNALSTFNKQIVLASDRHPRELKTLEDRLRSRFEGGLVSDVQPLEFETRLAILEMWAQERGIILDMPVLEVIARRAPASVRELEGVFTQVVAKTQHSRSPLTLQGAESIVEYFERPRDHHQFQRRVTADQVVQATAEHFRMSPRDLTGKRRTGRINLARQVAMYLARELTDASLPQIGEAFGGRSHTTILHGCNKIADEVSFDPGLRQRIAEIRSRITSQSS